MMPSVGLGLRIHLLALGRLAGGDRGVRLLLLLLLVQSLKPLDRDSIAVPGFLGSLGFRFHGLL